MEIPDRLSKKLEQNSALHGAVLQSIAEFKPWFDTSKTPFFPEYTDHNWTHVVQTMATASSLIREESWPLVTSSDAAIIVLAVILHDCGMHLTEEGFLKLINDDSNKRVLAGWTEKGGWPSFLLPKRSLLWVPRSSRRLRRAGTTLPTLNDFAEGLR